MSVASPSPAAFRDDDLVAAGRQIAKQVAPFNTVNQCAGRNTDDSIRTTLTGFQLALTVTSPLALPVFVSDQMGEVCQVRIGLEDHSATRSAVAAIRPAARHVSFPAKAEAAVSAIASPAVKFNFVNKHEREVGQRALKQQAGTAYSAARVPQGSVARHSVE